MLGGDPPPVFQATEHNLHPLPPFVAPLVIFDGLVARLSLWDVARYPLISNSFTKPICIISPICQKSVGGGQAIRRDSGLSVIADLASSQEERDRPPNYFIHDRQLGIDTTLGPPNQASAPLFFNRRLDAVQCALTYVASIEIVLGSGDSAASPVMKWANTLMPHHRFQRL